MLWWCLLLCLHVVVVVNEARISRCFLFIYSFIYVVQKLRTKKKKKKKKDRRKEDNRRN